MFAVFAYQLRRPILMGERDFVFFQYSVDGLGMDKEDISVKRGDKNRPNGLSSGDRPHSFLWNVRLLCF